MPPAAAPYGNGRGYKAPVTVPVSVPELPRTSPEGDIARQQTDDEGLLQTDPYLAGFLAGLAAANANIVEAGGSISSENSHVAWPLPASINPSPTTLPLVGSAPQSHIIHGTNGASTSLQPQESLSDTQLRGQPAMQPDLLTGAASWGVYGQLLDFDSTTSAANPPPLSDGGWIRGSSEAANAPANQPLLAIDWDPTLSQQLTPGLTGSQLNYPALSQSQPFALEATEGHNGPPAGIATNVDQPWDFVSTHALPTTAEFAFTQARDSPDASTAVPQYANADDLELFLNTLAPDTNRSQKRQKSCVSSVCILHHRMLRLSLHRRQSSSVVTTRIAESAVQTVFRAYGQKRSRFSEQLRTRTALTRKLGACAVCRAKKLRVSWRSLSRDLKATLILPVRHILKGEVCALRQVRSATTTASTWALLPG